MKKHDPTNPVYCKIRNFLGEKDLVMSLYTQKCQFNCKFCILKKNSSDKPVPAESQKKQLDYIFRKFRSQLDSLQRISIGNEGSIFDSSRVPSEVLEYLAKRCSKLAKLKTISFETRPEFINYDILRKMKKLSKKEIDCTVGFETRNKKLQEKMNKSLSEIAIEKALDAISKTKSHLTAYVILKPCLFMSEQEAIKEALSSVNYLVTLTKRKKVPLIIYLNPLYIPSTGPLYEEAKQNQYSPPLACTLIKVLERIIKTHPKLKVYIGLYSEGLAKQKGQFFCPRINSEIWEKLKEFNKTQNSKLIINSDCQKCELYEKKTTN